MSTAKKPVKSAAQPAPVPATMPAPAAAPEGHQSLPVASFGGGLLATLAAHAKDVAEAEKVTTSAISMRGGVMTWQGKPVPGNKMTVIVVATSYENTWYSKRFDPNKLTSPACFAQSLTDDGMVPHENSVLKQSDDCASCPLHQWGSDPGGGRGKACKEIRKLAIIPAYDDVDELTTAEIATIKVPVMSVKEWSAYANERATVDKLPYWAFLTEVAPVPDPRSQFRITFKKAGVLPDEASVRAVMARIAQAQNLLMTPYEPMQEDEEEEAPAAKTKKF